MELSFCARPVAPDKWKVTTPVGKYVITQEENNLGNLVYWIQSPVGRRLDDEATGLDEAEQIVSTHYQKHYKD
jgi:hypothetical protein